MPILNRRTVVVAIAALGVGTYLGLPHVFPVTGEGLMYYTEDGLALRGTDPVSYFTKGAPEQGTPEHAVDWSGATWLFASAEHKAAFEADPTRYAPQYGGYCAWAVAEKGKLYSTRPENWAIVDDRLYLNFNDGVQAKWNKDRVGFIALGDQRWPEVRTVLQ